MTALTPAEVARIFGIDTFHLPLRATATLPHRLISRLVEDQAGHWIWTGARDGNGYGMIGRGGRGTGNIGTHAAMWQMVHGQPEDGLVYDHLCRTPLCCNPQHGEYVTRRENNLRGTAPCAIWAAREVCSNGGHPLDGKKSTYRYCKTCARARSAAYYARRRAVAA